MTPEETLNLKMIQPNDAGAETIRDYLKALLTDLWRETEGFSGKRPFGNSGWEYEVYNSLVEAGAVPARYTIDGDLWSFDEAAADKLIFKAIEAL